MHYIRYAFLGALGIVLISVSLANRGMVTLKLMPDAFAELAGFNYAISLPLFVVVLAGIGVGLLVGFVWEYLREHKHRRDATGRAREVRRLERKIERIKDDKNKDKDDVIALLEEAS